MINILIVSHIDFDSTYGASTSLRYHLELLSSIKREENLEFYVVNRVSFLKYFFLILMRRDRISKSNIQLIYKWEVPFSSNCDGVFDNPHRRAKRILYNYFLRKFYRELYRLIISKDIKVLHLNSPVLIDIASSLKSDFKLEFLQVILHVRDFIKIGLSEENLSKFNFVNKYICIDFATKSRLIQSINGISKDDIHVLQNIFQKSSNLPLKLGKKYFCNSKIKYAIVGRISEEKGVLRMVNLFLEANMPNTVIFVVGGGDSKEINKLVQICKKNINTVVYLGEVKNISQTSFFSDINYLIRGDKSFRTGRTVYEALVNEAKVILPGSDDDLCNDIDLHNFKDEVFLYDPNSDDSVVTVFKKSYAYYSSKKPSINEYINVFEKKKSSYISLFLDLYS